MECKPFALALVIAAMSTFVFPSIPSATPSSLPENGATPIEVEMMRGLTLSEEQREKIEMLQLNRDPQERYFYRRMADSLRDIHEKIRNGSSLEDLDRSLAVFKDAAHDGARFSQAFQAILTEEQRAEFAQAMRQRRQRILQEVVKRKPPTRRTTSRGNSPTSHAQRRAKEGTLRLRDEP